MNRKDGISPRRSARGGQALAFVMMLITGVFGVTMVVLDVGIVLVQQNQLNASTQAAALAGGEAMGVAGATATTVTAAVTAYSSQTGGYNASTLLPGATLVSGYPALSCMTTLQTSFGLSCYGPSSTNALVVKQQITLPMFFANMFGAAGTLTLTSTATASMKAATSAPYNVVMIVDTTESMNTVQNSTDCKTSAISCALAGVQVLLQNLSPCPATQLTCGTAANGNVANSVDRVGLLTFPPVLATTVLNDFNCLGILPSIVPYTALLPITSTYQIVNFSSDYRTSDSVKTLNPNSNLVAAVGGGSCSGMAAPGGDGTYYAQAITQAQAYLAAEQLAYPNSKNVMILLSDGDASAKCTTSLLGVCILGPMMGASTTAATGAYPPQSTLQQCHQAISAAQAAWAAGTIVYAVNFGAEKSGCATDTSPTIDPCQTMLQMATYPAGSKSSTYFSDDPSSGVDSSCTAAARPTSTLNQIFQAIAGDLTYSKLIPNGTQ